MKKAGTVVFLLSLMMPCMAEAQSVREVEESAYILCSDMTGTDREAETCIDWVVTSTCASTYRQRSGGISKLVSDANFLRYLQEGENKLPAACEPYSAIELNFDILRRLNDDKLIQKRWSRIMFWANKLRPEQRPIVLNSMIQQDDFAEIYTRPEIKKFIQLSLADVENMLPNVSADIVSLLHALGKLNSSLLTPAAHAVLVNDEIQHQNYISARRRLLSLDLASQSENVKKFLLPVVEGAFFQMFGHADFKQIACYREVTDSKKSAQYRLFEFLGGRSESLNIAEHIIRLQLLQCAYEDAVSSLIKHYPRAKHMQDMDVLMNAFMEYAEKSHSGNLIASLVSHLASLDQAVINIFINKYGTRMTSLALESGRDALDRCDAASAQKFLEKLDRISPDSLLPEVYIEKGRALLLQKNGNLARANWNEVIGRLHRGPLVEQALYLTMMSLAKDGKANEAEQQRISFVESYPDSIWISRLPETFKGYKVASMSCK